MDNQYGSMPMDYSNWSGIGTPIENFSNEDNELLLSVLNSTPHDQMYNYYSPAALPPAFMGHYDMPGGFDLAAMPVSGGFAPKMNGPMGQQQPNIKMEPQRNSPQYVGVPMTMQGGHLGDAQLSSSSPPPNAFSVQPVPAVTITHPQPTRQHPAVANVVDREKTEDSSEEPDDTEEGGNQRNRRRESQNRASRNYRQRKKAYIKEIEAKLDQLKLENEQLKTENQKNRRTLVQFQSILDKPAPLLRSYSSELRTEDMEIEKIVLQLQEAAGSKDELVLRQLLDTFHQHSAKRQGILSKEAMQLINPKMQERLARLEGVPPQMADQQIGMWLRNVSQFVSPEQIQKLAELERRHMSEREAIWVERAVINRDIKEFYQEKLAGERLNTPVKLEQAVVLALTNKLEQLKKNLAREADLNNNSVRQFSQLLTPYQEALITIKHFTYYKDKISAIQMLNNVWSVLSKDK